MRSGTSDDDMAVAVEEVRSVRAMVGRCRLKAVFASTG